MVFRCVRKSGWCKSVSFMHLTVKNDENVLTLKGMLVLYSTGSDRSTNNFAGNTGGMISASCSYDAATYNCAAYGYSCQIP